MTPRRLRDLIVSYRPNPSRVYTTPTPITTPARAAAIFLPLIGNQPQEVIAALFLDARRHVIAHREIYHGTSDAEPTTLGDIILPALVTNAAALILAHNHVGTAPIPVHDYTPATRRLWEICAMLDIELADRMIFDASSYISFRATGRLPPK